jgi:hypothetical protein
MQLAIEDADDKVKALYDKLDMPGFRKKQPEKQESEESVTEKFTNDQSAGLAYNTRSEQSYLADNTDLYWQLYSQLGFQGLDKAKLATVDYRQVLGDKR